MRRHTASAELVDDSLFASLLRRQLTSVIVTTEVNNMLDAGAALRRGFRPWFVAADPNFCLT